MRPSGSRNGRIKFGTESSGGFRNCVVSNCTFRSCKGLALEEVDGGTMEDISVTNLTMVDVARYAIYITTGTRNRGGDVRHPSRCRNILISNVIADNVDEENGIQVTGIPGHPIEGVLLENIRLISKGGGTAQDATWGKKELGTGYPEPSPIPVYGIYVQHVQTWNWPTSARVLRLRMHGRPRSLATWPDWRSITSSRRWRRTSPP